MSKRLLTVLGAAVFLFSASAKADVDSIARGMAARALAGGGALTSGTTSTNCTALNLFYADATSKFGCMAGTSWDNTNRSLTITGAAVTTSHPVLELSQPWNNAATVFTGIDFNITNTASAATSLPMNLRIGGTSLFSVRIDGFLAALSGYRVTGNSGTISLRNGNTVIQSPAAATLNLGNADAAAPAAQTLGVQSVVAGTANTAGALWSLKLSASTGSAVGGDLDVLGTPAGGAGSTQNAYVSFLKLRAADKSALFGSYIEMAEMTAPAAPSANGARLYCDDNGAAKTRCSIIFASGAAQQIAIEP